MSVFVDFKQSLISQDGAVYRVKKQAIQHVELEVPTQHFTLFGQIMFEGYIHFLLTSTRFDAPHPAKIRNVYIMPKNDTIRQALAYVKPLLYLVERSPYQRFNNGALLKVYPAVFGFFKRMQTYSLQAVLISPLLTRFQRGLVDDVPANYLEMTIVKNGQSYVLTRGSVPFNFSQPMTWKYTPEIVFQEVYKLCLRDTEVPISLLNNTNANYKRLNSIFEEKCPEMVRFDINSKTQGQIAAFVADFLKSSVAEGQQTKIPRINCLDCVDRTTKLACEFAEQITGEKSARLVCYQASLVFGRLYSGTMPQGVIHDVTGRTNSFDQLINGALGCIRYLRNRLVQPAAQYYYDVLNEKAHFVCEKPFQRLSLAMAVAAIVMICGYFAGKKVFVAVGLVACVILC